MLRIILLFILAAVSGQAFAAEGTLWWQKMGFADVQTLIISIVLIVLSILVTAFIVKKFNHAKLQLKNGIKVLETMPMSKREILYLIEVDNRRILMARCSGKMQPIHAYPKDEACELRDFVEQGKITRPKEQAIKPGVMFAANLAPQENTTH